MKNVTHTMKNVTHTRLIYVDRTPRFVQNLRRSTRAHSRHRDGGHLSHAAGPQVWESALLVNVDNDTLRRILDNPEAMAAVERIEGWRALGDNIIETIINKSDKVKELKNKAKDRDLTEKERNSSPRRRRSTSPNAGSSRRS